MEVILRDGRTVTHLMPQPLGSWQNPMTNQEVNLKARDLLEPVIGPERTEAVIQGVNNLEGVGNIQELLPSLTLGPEDNLQK